MDADGRSIKLHSGTGFPSIILAIPLVIAAVSTLGYLHDQRGLDSESLVLGLALVGAFVLICGVVVAIRSAPRRLVVDAECVTLEGWRGHTVAQIRRAEARATPSVFFYSAFWSDSVIESSSPMLTLDFGTRVSTIMLHGGVSGWPREPVVKNRPRYRVNEEDFLWLAETFCSPASIAEVDFTERIAVRADT